ncbi:hypothetical protein [Muriicola sp.]|uniref:hypothetical protein n=1 Tax=Muriicola sp. TaxID=2020856 RepID=UPI003C768A48
MKFKDFFKSRWLLSLSAVFLFMTSCGPVILSSRYNSPPPPWFYPNRIEFVRYVYFPEYSIYYDLSARTYLYLDGGVWVRREVLPQRYQRVDLRRSRYERIRNYNDDNIRKYHEEHNANRGRSNLNTPRRNRN